MKNVDTIIGDGGTITLGPVDQVECAATGANAHNPDVSLRCGVERELLAEVLYHVQPFARLPAANNAAKAMLSP